MQQRCGSAFRCRGFWSFQHAVIPESRSLYDVASKFLVLLMSELVLHRLSGDTGFELGTQMPSFSFAHFGLISGSSPSKTSSIRQ
jgi:hypothetical protein